MDTGSEFTWLPSEVLERIGVEPVKKDLRIQMANGQIVTRNVGYVILRVDKYETTDEVVFAQQGDLSLLGARALEGMNVHVSARQKRLVAAAPSLRLRDPSRSRSQDGDCCWLANNRGRQSQPGNDGR